MAGPSLVLVTDAELDTPGAISRARRTRQGDEDALAGGDVTELASKRRARYQVPWLGTAVQFRAPPVGSASITVTPRAVGPALVTLMR